jgi:thiamine biosynthesis lipoprotein
VRDADALLTPLAAPEAMNTRFETLLPASDADESYASQVAHAVFEELDRLENELSRFRSQSDIFRVNRLRSGESTIVGLATLVRG